MIKDIITSLSLHVILFILFALGNLFFFHKVELKQINIALVSGGAVASSSYKPLILTQDDMYYNQLHNSNDINLGLKKIDGKGKDELNKDSLSNINKNQNFIPPLITEREVAKSSTKDNIVTQPTNTHKTAAPPINNEGITNDQHVKELFTNNIMAGLDKGSLSKQELRSLNNQIKGCWYGQGGYNSTENLKVELVLTMNPDATIKNIEVLNQETYNTPIRKAFLEQVLRALKDPKCRQLRLPMNSYNNWRIIHIIFDPKR